MTSEKNYKTIITSLQIGLWEAEYLFKETKREYWQGKISGLKAALSSLRALGINVNGVIEDLANPFA